MDEKRFQDESLLDGGGVKGEIFGFQFSEKDFGAPGFVVSVNWCFTLNQKGNDVIICMAELLVEDSPQNFLMFFFLVVSQSRK